MNLLKLSVLCLALAAFTGCQKTVTIPFSDNPSDTSDPTEAQPKLRTMKLYVGAETLDAELALTPREEQVGMMYRTNIQDTDAMLFDLHVPQQAAFWMEHCPESISAAYITPDGIIAEIHHLEKDDTNAVFSATNNIQFVLETSDGWFARHNVNTGMAIQTERGSLAGTFQGH